MSSKIKSPNESSNGFLWALLAVIVIAAVVVGYIVINGQKSHGGGGGSSDIAAQWEKQNVSFTETFADDAVTLKSASATAETPAVDLYEDFSCPHCSELAIASDDAMKDAIDQGKLVVNVRTLNFLDRGQDTDKGHSTRAGTAALAVAKSGDANLYWNFRAMLMNNQKDVYNKWDNEQFAKAAETLGASEDVTEAIKDEKEKDAFLKMKDTNTSKLEGLGRGVSSPRVINKDGQDVSVVDSSQQVSDAWVAQVTGS